MKHQRWSAPIAAVFCSSMFAQAQASDEIFEMSFEDLMSMEVTSVSKKPQSANEAAAALFVITRDDIRKSGATTIPELFRLAPGLDVATIDSSVTAVSVRGFNSRFANKLLVLVDGRAVYQGVFSGVLWDQQMVPVEDIDRIEIIRGPGATLYGANAVNGVINIVTKKTGDTLGGIASVNAGVSSGARQSSTRLFVRQGFHLGDNGAARLYVTVQEDPSLVDAGGDPFNDGTRSLQTGFRADWEPNQRDTFTLQGDYQTLDFDISLTPGLTAGVPPQTTANEAEGYNFLGRWSRSWTEANMMTLQVYFDHVNRTDFSTAIPINVLQDPPESLAGQFTIDTFDIDFSHRFSWGERFETIWGVGYRSAKDEVIGGDLIDFDVTSFNADLYNLFVQQDSSFFDDRLRVSVGSKFEQNDFTGFEIQPGARAIWIDEDWSLWAAVSRAVRTPSRFETSQDVTLGELDPDPLLAQFPFLEVIDLSQEGDPDLKAEDLLAVEFGFRKAWPGKISLDVAAYHNQYDDLIALVKGGFDVDTEDIGPGGTEVVVARDEKVNTANAISGVVYGLEASLQFQPADWWKIKLAGDVKKLDDVVNQLEVIQVVGQSFDFNRQGLGESPEYQVSALSNFDPVPGVSASVWLRHVGGLAQSDVDSYADMDVRVGFQLSQKVRLTLRAENLADIRRQEFLSEAYPSPAGFTERKFSVSAVADF